MSAGLGGIKWDSSGFPRRRGVVPHGPPGLPQHVLVDRRDGFRREPLARLGLRRLGRLLRFSLPREAQAVGVLDAPQHQGEPRKLLHRHGLPARGEVGHGGEHHRPHGLDQDEPGPTLWSLAELLHPQRQGPLALPLLAQDGAELLGMAADGRARAVAALALDEGGDLVDGGAVGDGRIDGLAQLGRQLVDGGASERRGGRGLLGFVLHGGAALAGCFRAHRPMLPHPTCPLHRTMVRGVIKGLAHPPTTSSCPAPGSSPGVFRASTHPFDHPLLRHARTCCGHPRSLSPPREKLVDGRNECGHDRGEACGLTRNSHQGHGLRRASGVRSARSGPKSVSGNTVEARDAAGGRLGATRRAALSGRHAASRRLPDVPASRRRRAYPRDALRASPCLSAG